MGQLTGLGSVISMQPLLFYIGFLLTILSHQPKTRYIKNLFTKIIYIGKMSKIIKI
jgi:hypothetical protein